MGEILKAIMEPLKKWLVQFVINHVLTALVPMLANPILGFFASFALRKLVDWGGAEIALKITYLTINKEVQSEVDSVKEVEIAFKEDQAKPKEQRDAAKTLELKKQLEEKARELIRYRRSK